MLKQSWKKQGRKLLTVSALSLIVVGITPKITWAIEILPLLEAVGGQTVNGLIKGIFGVSSPPQTNPPNSQPLPPPGQLPPGVPLPPNPQVNPNLGGINTPNPQVNPNLGGINTPNPQGNPNPSKTTINIYQ